MISGALDTLLDRTVVGGYSNVGYRLRSRGWAKRALPRITDQTVLITGASSGLGEAAAEGFARLGAGLRLLVRDEVKGERTRARIIERTGNQNVEIELCDLADLGSIRRFVKRFEQWTPRLDVLVNNAGVMSAERQESVDGIELTFATNVVGPFLLTNLLTGMLARNSSARIVNVSSGGMYTQRLDVDDLQFEHGEFDGVRAYAQTKRAEVVLSEIWARRLAGTGVVVHAMHPGWVDTPGLRSSLPRFAQLTGPVLRDVEAGADTIVWLGAADEPSHSSGLFWQDRRPRPAHYLARTRESEAERARLWEECVRLSGWREPAGETRGETVGETQNGA